MEAKKKRIVILSAVAAVLLVLMIVVTSVMYGMKEYMDQFLGRGERVVTGSGKGLDSNYIDFTAKSRDESYANAQKVTQQTAEEGMVLLRNDGAILPLNKDTTKLTLLGYATWHNNMAGGEDPATTRGAVSLGKGIEEVFGTNTQVTALYTNEKKDVKTSALDAVKNTFSEYKTAVITIKRNSGEGNDQTVKTADGRTGLTLTPDEMQLIDYACKNFESVIILVNSVNTMELGFLDPADAQYKTKGQYTDPYDATKTYDFSKIKAAVWAGGCGSQAGKAIANILSGAVNPSGHLSDIYARDLTKDPTYVNFGDFRYDNSSELNSYAAATYFVEYEEGIYTGYRYHETAAFEAAKGNYAGYDYDKAVVYPFGYGMSYTTFKTEYSETPVFDAATDKYTFKVKVTNNGEKKGKGVAQIYVSMPWKSGQVEKSHIQLVGFAKTAELNVGASETLTITVSRDYFTPYDYKNEKCYVLDEGEYKFYLSENSHSWAEIDKMSKADQAKVLWTDNVTAKKVYKDGKDGKRTTDLVVAANVEDFELNWKFKAYNDGSAGDGYIHDFTRADFKASFPTAPTGNDKKVTNAGAKEQIAKYNVWQDTIYNTIDKMPQTNVDKTAYVLADMRGVDFNDPKWDDYINQFTVESMAYMFSNGGWQEAADEENGVPLSVDMDSPYGYYGFQAGVKSGDGNTWYCSAPMLAATFNVQLAKEVGYAFAEEAYYLSELVKAEVPITGLYGYGLNQHRSAFGGRNYEYYSEDPILAGKIAAAESSGASEKGLITFMKHYALNEQELHRQDNGYCSYVNEQAFREVYLRGWELYMKEAKMKVKYYDEEGGKFVLKTKEMPAATGIMTAYNRIGGRYAGASDSINDILRAEFGFTGTVLTDAGGEPMTYMTTDLSLRQGQNLTLCNNGTNGLYDTESPTAVAWLKTSTKYLLYNKANSNCVIGLSPGERFYYTMSPWQIVLIVAWVVVGLAIAAAAAYITLILLGKIQVKETVKKQSRGDEY